MDCQDWTPVVARRRLSKREAVARGQSAIVARDSEKGERTRLAKLEEADVPPPKKRISPESLQALIRKRIEMNLTQEKADGLCSFPRNTFKEFEANRAVPNEQQKQRIHQNFGIAIKVVTI